MELISFLGQVLGIPVAAAFAVAVAVYIAKSALAKAVEQAGQQELERLRNSLSKELEAQKAEAARTLESFKAQLTLEAEVKRQMAQRKVEALLELYSLCEPLFRDLVNPEDPRDRTAVFSKVLPVMTKVRDKQVFFSESTREVLMKKVNLIHRAAIKFNTRDEGDALDAGMKAYGEMIEIFRQELGTATNC